METCLALDIGGSKYMVGLLSRDGKILERRRGAWQTRSADEVLEHLLRETRMLLEQTQVRPVACGVTIPGLADPARGLWVEASFSGIRNFAICEALQRELGIPVHCENDGQAYAMAEMRYGSCQNTKDFIFINVSNGIGGAIVCGGQLVKGHTSSAGEFGHCHVQDGGRPCKCGQTGCLEMHAAGPAISRNYMELGGSQDEQGKAPDCRVIAERARMGDAIALETFKLEGRYLGRVIAMAVNMLNPQKVVIGGGVSLAFDLFGDSLRHTVKEQTYAYANRKLEILPTPLGYDAGLYSGAAIALAGQHGLR